MLRTFRNRVAFIRAYTSVSELYISQPSIPDTREENRKLLQLVKQGQYAAAERLRLRLVEHDIPIHSHTTYESVALARLRFKADDFKGFSTWLSLTPDKNKLDTDEDGVPRPYTALRHALFEAGSPADRVPAIYHFGLIIASKGYEDIVLRDVVPFLTRFASPERGVRFLCEFETACLGYQDKSQSGQASSRGFLYARKLRERSLRLCCHAGWIDEAASLLRQSTHLGISTAVCRMVQSMRNE